MVNRSSRAQPGGWLSTADVGRRLRPLAVTIALSIHGLAASPTAGGPAANLARAIHELRFDRDSCYRVRDLEIVKEDIRIYLNGGHLILSKPLAGKPIAAVFVADVDGGDGEVLLLAPDRAERTSLAAHIHSPNLDENFQSAMFVFTGDDASRFEAQIAANPASRKTPEVGALLDDDWSPVLHTLSGGYRARLVLDLLGGPGRELGLFTAIFSSRKLGNFEVCYDPESSEQILAGGTETHEGRVQFETWTSFPARSSRQNPAPRRRDFTIADYRIDASIGEDLGLNAVTRCRLEPVADGLAAVAFDLSDAESVSSVRVDGRDAEVLEPDPAPAEGTRGGTTLYPIVTSGNRMFVVMPPEPLRAGRSYEFEFHHSGKVIQDAGDRVLYVTARGTWYPVHGLNFAAYDLRFRYPKDLVLAGPGTPVEQREDGQWRYTELRTDTAIRVAAFNLGNYAHTRETRGNYIVDVYANRALEASLKPQDTILPVTPVRGHTRVPLSDLGQPRSEAPPDPLGRLKDLAAEVANALEFMTARFGAPALPHLAVSPIPGTFGQGFPGLIYLSTLSYLKTVPVSAGSLAEAQELFFQQVLQAHETAHQWWGNRVTTGSYRDNWMMEALANYSALLYLEKTRGAHAVDMLLDNIAPSCWRRGKAASRLNRPAPSPWGRVWISSQDPGAWRTVTYGKGTWIIHMLRRYLGDQRFFAMLNEVLKRYDHQEMSTEDFRRVAARFTPPKTDDADLETFFDTWVYSTGIPTLKMSYS